MNSDKHNIEMKVLGSWRVDDLQKRLKTINLQLQGSTEKGNGYADDAKAD